MRTTDAYLTRLARRTWPAAYVEIEEPPVSLLYTGHARAYYLYWSSGRLQDEPRVLGFTFREAKSTLNILRTRDTAK